MSAGEELRTAARLMRERAVAATAATGEWSVSYIPEQAVPNAHIIDRWYVMDRFENGQETGPYAACEYGPAATYIAAMGPTIAVTVADWLDHEARVVEEYTKKGIHLSAIRVENALAVARAYLREES